MATAAKAGPEERQLATELVHMVLPAPSYDKMIENMMAQILAAGGRNVSEDERIRVTAALREVIPYDEMVGWSADAYESRFTAGELREMIAFYKTPTGQKAARLLPELMAEGGRRASEVVPQRLPAALERHGFGRGGGGHSSERRPAGKEAEARANLKAMFVSEKAYYQEKDAFSEKPAITGFSPEGGNRYAYYLSDAGPIQRRASQGAETAVSPEAVIIGADEWRYPEAKTAESVAKTGCHVSMPEGIKKVGVTGSGPADQVFVGLAVSTVVGDPPPDCWSISTAARVDERNGNRIAAGEPYHESGGK